MGRWVVWVIALLAGVGSGQEEGLEQKAIDLRVTHVRAGGVVVVDRGERDGVELRDRVVLHPRGAASVAGVVTLVEERSAEVRLGDSRAVTPLGCRGIAHVSAPVVVSVVEPEPAPLPLSVVDPVSASDGVGNAPENEGADGQTSSRSPWSNPDADYDPSLPLLTRIDSIPPEDRTPLVSGRLYTIANFRATNDDRSDAFARFGSDLHYENPFGNGGELVFEGETNYRHTEVTDQVDESTTRARIDRLSYAWGGTRFAPHRHELGRFLHHSVPELGVLDGYEWSRRLAGGGRVGASGGYLPEPTPTMTTGRDLCASLFYQWAADQREELTATAAYQKSWHDGAADRDLVLGKLDYWPADAWDFHGTAWVDWYTSGDANKGAGPELTRLVASTGRTWSGGDGLNLAFTHDRFPETERDELNMLLSQQLADDHDERLSLSAWTWLREDRRLNGRAGVWGDQEDSGGDLELGLEQHELGHEDGRGSAALFAVSGKFSTVYGARLAYGMQGVTSRWDLSYEFALSDQVGFSAANDEIEQHRILASHDYQSDSGWSVSLHAGASLWTQESALTIGLYLQRSF